ncbi:MAG: hypothetical protein ACQETH_15175 [Candidatus Rifleibacteriota bacterium]
MCENEWFNDDDLKAALKLTYAQRLEMLQNFNAFILSAMSKENLKIAMELRKSGF